MSCLLARLQGMPPVSFRIVTGAPKAKACDGLSAAENQQTSVIKEAELKKYRIVGLPQQFVFCFVFVFQK